MYPNPYKLGDDTPMRLISPVVKATTSTANSVAYAHEHIGYALDELENIAAQVSGDTPPDGRTQRIVQNHNLMTFLAQVRLLKRELAEAEDELSADPLHDPRPRPSRDDDWHGVAAE